MARLAGTHRIVALAPSREGRQQIPSMVPDTALRHHASPVGHVCVVSERKDAGGRKIAWEEGLGPGLRRVSGRPRLLAVPSQAVDEDDAGRSKLASAMRLVALFILDDGVVRAMQQLDARGKGFSGSRCGRALWWVVPARSGTFLPGSEQSRHSAGSTVDLAANMRKFYPRVGK